MEPPTAPGEPAGSGPCGRATARRAAEVRGWWWREGGGAAPPLPSVLPWEGADGKEGSWAEEGRTRRVSPAGASRRQRRLQAPGLPGRSRRAGDKAAEAHVRGLSYPRIRSRAARAGPVCVASTPLAALSHAARAVPFFQVWGSRRCRVDPSRPEFGSQPPRSSGHPAPSIPSDQRAATPFQLRLFPRSLQEGLQILKKKIKKKIERKLFGKRRNVQEPT